ncbi:MAG: saccharopine dehydrogenase NADP-binding domain-containing protein [Thermoplasmata archaeon]|nr:saccharopine dehydrogenase NADP-binding domain-containing protein [Thermoplasmata archaeon]
MIATHLARSDRVGELIVADVDHALADAAVKRTLPSTARAVALDAKEPAAVAEAAHGCRLIINASLPRFNRSIQQGAWDAGANYMDLASDSTDPYADSESWRRRSLTAVVGMGEDPGLSNVLVRHAADALDSVVSVRIRDGDSATSPDFPFLCLFSPETFIEETLHPSRIFQEGRYVDVPPFGASEEYDFPAPVGRSTVYSVDHEEVDSLPRFIGKGVQYVDFKLALDEGSVRTLKLIRDLKLFEHGPPGGTSPRRTLLAALPRPGDLAGRIDGSAALVAEVSGVKDGCPTTFVLGTTLGHTAAFSQFGTTGTSYLTGTPAAAAALLLLDGDFQEPGLFPPESLPPAPFLRRLAERGVPVFERITVERTLPN